MTRVLVFALGTFTGVVITLSLVYRREPAATGQYVDLWWTPDCGYTHVARDPATITAHCPDGHRPERTTDTGWREPEDGVQPVDPRTEGLWVTYRTVTDSAVAGPPPPIVWIEE